MTTGTLTLADFLLARIAEDEAAARAATPGPWRWGENLENGMESATALGGSVYSNDERGSYLGRYMRLPSEPLPTGARPEWEFPVNVISASGFHTEGFVEVERPDADHIARWDPARVLAECDAKRRMVEMHKPWHGSYECPVCADGASLDHGEVVADRLRFPCPTLRLLAVPYADHEDYDPSWRP